MRTLTHEGITNYKENGNCNYVSPPIQRNYHELGPKNLGANYSLLVNRRSVEKQWGGVDPETKFHAEIVIPSLPDVHGLVFGVNRQIKILGQKFEDLGAEIGHRLNIASH